MPIFREIFALNAESPMNLQIEKPPRFIVLGCQNDPSYWIYYTALHATLSEA